MSNLLYRQTWWLHSVVLSLETVIGQYMKQYSYYVYYMYSRHRRRREGEDGEGGRGAEEKCLWFKALTSGLCESLIMQGREEEEIEEHSIRVIPRGLKCWWPHYRSLGMRGWLAILWQCMDQCMDSFYCQFYRWWCVKNVSKFSKDGLLTFVSADLLHSVNLRKVD